MKGIITLFVSWRRKIACRRRLLIYCPRVAEQNIKSIEMFPGF